MKRKDKSESCQQADSMITEEFRMTQPASKIPFNKRQIVFVSYTCIVLYSASVFVQNSIMPYKVKNLGVGAAMFGYLQTLYAICQLCGAPLFGRFGDVFESKLALIIAFIATGLSYFILGTSTTVLMLFISRLPTVLMHVMQGSQMIITDVTDDKERADALGKSGVAFGIGMICGPFIGGIITKQFGEFVAACCAILLCVVGILIVLIFIPNHTKTRKKEVIHSPLLNGDAKQGDSAPTNGNRNVLNVQKFLHLISIPSVGYVLFVKSVCGIPMGIFHSMFAVVAVEYFDLQPEQNGMVMSYIGIVGLITQGMGIAFLTKRFSERKIFLGAIVSISFSYFLMVMVGNIYHFCIAALPLVVGGSALTVITNSVLTKSVPPSDTGATLGISMAINSLIRTVSPTIGGLLLSAWGFPSFGAVGFITTSTLILILALIRSPI